ncbi:MAG TPA: hypothetical protein VEU30_08250 [Thermoanaerobaculia bacterium]|nr:hypothetical protein [Thermoanaerobaculia bacterium]
MLRFLAVLAIALSVNAATPHVGAEVPLAGIDDGPALESQWAPAIASRGEEAFAVWADYRGYADPVVMGSRIAGDGTFLDRQGILIDVNPAREPTVFWSGMHIQPQIAWSGSEYFVIHTRREVYPLPNGRVDTFLNRVTPDGKVTARVPLPGLFGTRLFGSNHGVFAVAQQNGEWIFGRLGADGTLTDTMKFPSFLGLAVVADGEDWVYFRTTQLCDPDCGIKMRQGRIRGTKIVSEEVLDLSWVRVPSSISAATDGNGRFLVAWNEVRADAPRRYRGGIISIVTDADANLVAQPAELDRVETEFPEFFPLESVNTATPNVTWFRDQFVATWTWFDGSGRTDIRAASLSRDGKPARREPYLVDTHTQLLSRAGKAPIVAATHSGIHMMWAETRLEGKLKPDDVWVRSTPSLDALATVPPAQSATSSATRHESVSVAASDDGVFTVWTEESQTTSIVRGRLVRYDGSESPLLAMGEAARSATGAAVAFSGGVWLVTWTETVFKERLGELEHDGWRRMMLRFDRHGRALDSAPVQLVPLTNDADATGYSVTGIGLAGGGPDFVLVWPAVERGDDRQLRVSRIAADGTQLDPEPRLIYSVSPQSSGGPNAIWTGSGYFLIWRETEPEGGLGLTARATRLNADGTVAADFPRLFTTSGGWDLRVSSFETATNERKVLVTWSEQHSQSRGCAYAQLFTLDGAPAGPKHELKCGAGDRVIPGRLYPVWDGARFQVIYNYDDVVWAHPVDGQTAGAAVPLFATTGAIRVFRPVATPNGVVLTYTRSVTGFGSLPRVFRRTVSFNGSRRRSVR